MKVGFIGLWFVVFTALKVTNVANVSWGFVLAPLILWFVVALVIETRKEAKRRKRLGQW